MSAPTATATATATAPPEVRAEDGRQPQMQSQKSQQVQQQAQERAQQQPYPQQQQQQYRPQQQQRQSPPKAQQDTPQSPPQQPPKQGHPMLAEREAYEHWGYLFKPDKTGTDKLKGLLRGLKEVMHAQDPSETRDLSPTQLAHFYRSLHGNYDQLFLGTPSESIAFIYKSLGCLHSLQPLAYSTAFTEPSVPALKTDGWILWQTIQLLLGPDEHSGFLIEAVQKWDVKDPLTGEAFPKLLPRQCFPLEPDKHMVAWYEGVSERLRREAEQQELQREVEAEQAEVRRLKNKPHRSSAEPVTEAQLQRQQQLTDDEDSLDSRGPALAYFRNPLYRHIDGRPSIVRHESRRPGLSPRPTSMIGKGKEAASTLTHVVRNIGSPHLWTGRGTSADARDRERRRRSLPDHRHHHAADGQTAASTSPEALPPPQQQQRHRHHHSVSPAELSHPPSHHRSSQLSASADDDEWDEWDDDDRGSPVYSPDPSPGSHQQQQYHHQRPRRESSLRHSRSHEPTPSQKDIPDYFSTHPTSEQSTNDNPVSSPPLHNIDTSTSATGSATGSASGRGFGPSVSPLFAARVALQPSHHQPHPQLPPPSLEQPPPSHYYTQQQHRRQPSHDQNTQRPRYSSADPHPADAAGGGMAGARRSSQLRGSRPYSQSPADVDRRPRRESSQPRRARFERSPGLHSGRDREGNGERSRSENGSRSERGHDGRARNRERDVDREVPQNGRWSGGRRSGNEASAPLSSIPLSSFGLLHESGRRPAGSSSFQGVPPPPPLQRSFNADMKGARSGDGRARDGELRAVSGVDGRRYVDGTPWR